ncbi:DUF4345 domain-containing protein [Streptomyces erythrochromogenes]|uniref:DUF4345 domain-containing protein n=1 Tax=Streptomyces erythrochromogenes TaxID=285574 RepID=UPI00225C365E|nr:DUF4345 domain-containing protein [Streptomyces erythrochromogenes]MCX5582213.1 DUF4345 domain-containing protein [Streptomyces erythrochromogenes]
MARALKWLVLTTGVACVAIGPGRVALGNAAVPGIGAAGATVDSLGRFLGAAFAGYGLARIWAARQSPIPANVVRWLAAVFLLGAAGRLLSLAVHGWPHGFQVGLLAIELAMPPLYFRLADADERAHSQVKIIKGAE